MKLKTLLFLSFFCFGSTSNFFLQSQAENVDLTSGLYAKIRSQQGTLRTFKKFIEDDGSLLNPGEARKIARFFTHREVEPYALEAQVQLEGVIRDSRVLNALTYLMWIWSTEEHTNNVYRLVELYYSQLYIALKESAGDPRVPADKRAEMQDWISRIYKNAQARRFASPQDEIYAYRPVVMTCLASIPPAQTYQPMPEFRKQAVTRVNMLRRCLQGAYPARGPIPFSNLDLRVYIPAHPGSVISESGFIPGNKVQVLNLNKNTFDFEYTQIVTSFMNQVIKPYEEKWDLLNDEQQITQMKSLITQAKVENKNPLHAVFIEATGGRPEDIVYQNGNTILTKADALNIDRNPIWQFYGSPSEYERQTFPNIVRVIREAQSTIFIDLFFYGGTMGLAITDLLIKEMAKKPNLKVMLLRDTVNHFGHRSEMKPVYNYLRALMSLEPKRIMALPSNIFDKRVNGYPDFFKNFISDDSLKKFGLDQRMSLYLKAQSDHSKLLIVDGDQPMGKPQMIVGSKNWTDASGAVCNDENVLIQGPAAVVALNNYYEDMYEG
ncbi:MAG: hypothetical protein ACK5WZ_04210, partial [Pseudobdellovibrionaceae bacterium]